MEKSTIPIGNTIFVDKVLGRNIEHAKPCDPKKPYNSVYDAVKIAKSFKDAVLIRVSPGIFTEPDLDISDNLTIKGSGRTATQIYTTVNTRKLNKSATIKNLSIIGINKPCILSLGFGTLNLCKINLQACNAPLGILISGNIQIIDFQHKVNFSSFTSGNMWKHWGGRLTLKNGVQDLDAEAYRCTSATEFCNKEFTQKFRNFILSENLQIKITDLQESINFYQPSGNSQIGKNFTIKSGELVNLTPIGHRWKFSKLPIGPADSIIYQVAENPLTINSTTNLELKERYAKITINHAPGAAGSIILLGENCLYLIDNTDSSEFTLIDTKNNTAYPLSGKTSYRVIGKNYKEKFRVYIDPICRSSNFHLDIDSVEDTIHVPELNKIQNSTNICAGSVNTIPINGGDIHIKDQTGTYSINSGSGNIYFPIPTPDISINIGNPGYQYTAIAPIGYNFMDPDTQAQVSTLDLSRYVIWRFTSDTMTKIWSASTSVSENINITYTNSKYKSNLKNSKILEIGSPSVRVGINNLTLEDSEYIPLAIINNSGAIVINNNMVSI